MKLHPIFTDRMVLPVKKPLRIFGEGDKTVTVSLNGQTAVATPIEGKWLAQLSPMTYGGPYTLTVTDGDSTVTCADVHIGEVYLCSGQSNMQFCLADSSTPPEEWRAEERLRFFTCDRLEPVNTFTAADGWTLCTLETAGERSALAYYIGQLIAQKKGIAVGAITCHQGASAIESWVPAGLFQSMGIDIPAEEKNVDHYYPPYDAWSSDGALYDNMVRQIVPYALTGVIWYQGESDAGVSEGKVYDRELTALIDQWRKDFKDDALPFVVVQIADFDTTGYPEGWKLVQEAQAKVGQTVSQVKTVISRDISESDDVHPRTKDKLAARIVDAIYELTE